MAGQGPIPVIISVGDMKKKSSDSLEPMQLMLQAIRVALKDRESTGFLAPEPQSSVDDISIVATWTWPYPDLPSLLATKLGVQPRHKHYSEHGGNQPAKLLDEASRRM